MKVNFVGSFTTGYVGETSDESHLAREIEALGHAVRKLPRDEWREHAISGRPFPNIPSDLKADINIIAKWNGFYDGSFAHNLRIQSGAPVLYWVWDYMQGEDWHMKMVQEADLYLSNDVHSGRYNILKYETPYYVDNLYYFPFDVADEDFPKFHLKEKTIDVAFFGSWVNQGNRQEWLKEINKEIPVSIFSWNWMDWPKEFMTYPPVYGSDFCRTVANTKICLGFSVNPNTWGYWSNRTGKTLLAGGFLLYQYAPGMELFLRDGVEYFSSPQEAIEKINYYLSHDDERGIIANRGYEIGKERFTSKARVKDLMILAERFIKKGQALWRI